MSGVAEVRALARREVLRTMRNPPVAIQSVVFPAILLLVLLAVFGTAVGEVDGQRYVQRLAPAMIVSGAAFGSIGAAVGVFTDKSTGMFARLRTLPIGRNGTLVARWCAEALRVLAVVVVITLIAVAFGFRVRNGLVPAVGFVALAVVCGSSFCWVGFALATRATTQEAVGPPVSIVFLVLLFLSRGLVPIAAFPGWIQPVVRYAPNSMMVDALQRLVNGGALTASVLGALAWSTAITLGFAWLALRGLRDAQPGRA